MSGELNTEVHDEPESCRRTADWLGRLQPEVARIGDAVHHQRSASQAFWEGTAGEVCRRELGDHGKDADELEDQLRKVREALLTFAGAIDAVRRSMTEARSAASAAGLIVTPTAILPPEPTAQPATPLDPAAHQAFQQARADYGRKQQAFESARDEIDSARERQEQAHKTLQKSMEDPLEVIKTTKTWAMFFVGHGLSTLKSSFGEVQEWTKKAADYETAATSMRARAEGAYGHMRTIAMNAADKGDELAKDATRRAAAAGRFGANALSEGVGGFISRNAGEFVDGGGKVAKYGSKFLSGVPFLGTGLSVASGVGDVVMGKDPVEAAEDTAANVGGGAAGGWAGAAVGTAICPGVGTVIGGVVGGIAGSMGATKAVSAAREE